MKRFIFGFIIGMAVVQLPSACAMESNTSAQNKVLRECDICLVDKPQALFHKLQNCDHSFCIPCLRTWASNRERARVCALCRAPWTGNDLFFQPNLLAAQPIDVQSNDTITINKRHFYRLGLIAVPVLMVAAVGCMQLYKYLYVPEIKEPEYTGLPVKNAPQQKPLVKNGKPGRPTPKRRK